VLGFLFHVAGDVLRGVASGRVPWSNMYEFALTGTMLIVAVYLVVLFKYDLRASSAPSSPGSSSCCSAAP
jgi:ABC-type transport system involved in cytochrome c biogenesis permease subunit